MSVEHKILRPDSFRQRPTIADGLDVLVQDMGFRAGDLATVKIQGLQLANGAVVWLVALVYQDLRSQTQAIVPLHTASAFSAQDSGTGCGKTAFPIERLDDAIVDYDGVLSTLDGTKLRAVQLTAVRLSLQLTETQQKIIHVALGTEPDAERRYYRDIRDDLPHKLRHDLPPLAFLDFAKVAAEQRRAPMRRLKLKAILQQFARLFPDEQVPSAQTVANALECIGVRSPRRRAG